MSDFENTIDKYGDEAVMDSLISRTITEFKDDVITKVGSYAFSDCKELTEVELPNCAKLEGYEHFVGCTGLRKVSLPSVTAIAQRCFRNAGNSELEVYVPSATDFYSGAFSGAKAKLIDTSNLTTINLQCFMSGEVTHLVLRNNAVCKLIRYEDGIKNVTYIYVPSRLIDAYQNDESWKEYSEKFRAVEDYTKDGKTTGELDWEKINGNT